MPECFDSYFKFDAGGSFLNAYRPYQILLSARVIDTLHPCCVVCPTQAALLPKTAARPINEREDGILCVIVNKFYVSLS